jgi:hypothetical protein
MLDRRLGLPGLSSEVLAGGFEVEPFHVLDELDHVLICTAGEAMTKSLGWAHPEGRIFVCVERAQAHELSAPLLQRDIRPDDRNDVGASFQPVYVDAAHALGRFLGYCCW